MSIVEITLARIMAEEEPENPKRWEMLGSAYLDSEDSEDYEVAEESFLKALSLDEHLESSWALLMETYYMMDAYEKGLDVFNKIGHKFEENDLIWRSAAMIYRSTHDYDNAIRCYKNLLRFNPEFIDALSNLGALYHSKNEGEKSIACFEKIMEIDPENYEALVNLAIAYGRYHHDDDKAVDLVLRAIQINPKYITAWVTLGNIYKYEYGDSDEAEVYYEQARILENLV